MSIEERVERLEKRVNRYRLTVVLLASLMCGTCAMIARTEAGKVDRIEVDTLKATAVFAKYIGVEASLTDKVTVGIMGDAPYQGISIGPPSGENLVRITYDDRGGIVAVYDQSGKGRTLTPR